MSKVSFIEPVQRPEIQREIIAASAIGVIERPLSPMAKLLRHGAFRKGTLLIALALIWEVYGRYLDNPLLFSILQRDGGRLHRRVAQRGAPTKDFQLGEDTADGLCHRHRAGVASHNIRHQHPHRRGRHGDADLHVRSRCRRSPCCHCPSSGSGLAPAASSSCSPIPCCGPWPETTRVFAPPPRRCAWSGATMDCADGATSRRS